MDIIFKVRWPAGEVTLHGGMEKEAAAHACEYMLAKNLFTISPELPAGQTVVDHLDEREPV